MNKHGTISTRLLTLWERLRTNFWFVPALMSAGAAILALAMIALDATLSDKALDGLSWVYSGGPEGARALLSTVASSAITVAGTTFSITIAALSLAASQFGPRLLRTFVRDTGNQLVLGTFVATFLYCLLVLRTIRGLEDTRVVPHLSVTVGVMLAIANLAVLIYFIHHMAMAIRVDQVIAAVGRDLDTAIERLFPAMLGNEPESQEQGPALLRVPALNQPARVVYAEDDGYIQAIDAKTILDIAQEHDLLLVLEHRPGDFVFSGDVLAQAWPAEQLNNEHCNEIQAAFIYGDERSTQQDARFAINQLVEIGIRALSPGINDPFTALTCIDRLGAALRQVVRRPFPDRWRFDDQGKLRVVVASLDFADLLQSAFSQIRYYGRDNVVIVTHLLDTLARIAHGIDDQARKTAIRQQALLVYEGSLEALVTDGDRQAVTHGYQELLKQLAD